MSGTSALLTAGAVIAAIILGFSVIGTGIRLLDRLQDMLIAKAGWIILLGIGLWLAWVLLPGTHADLLKLWASLHAGAGQAVKGAKRVL